MPNKQKLYSIPIKGESANFLLTQLPDEKFEAYSDHASFIKLFPSGKLSGKEIEDLYADTNLDASRKEIINSLEFAYLEFQLYCRP